MRRPPEPRASSRVPAASCTHLAASHLAESHSRGISGAWAEPELGVSPVVGELLYLRKPEGTRLSVRDNDSTGHR